MSNMNNYAGFINLPAQLVSVNTEAGILVPAAGAYPGLPSPAQVAGNQITLQAEAEQFQANLSVAQKADVVSASVLDGRPFLVRISGKVFAAASENVTVNVYQVPFSVADSASMFSSGSQIATSGAMASGASGNFSFELEAQVIWDSVSKKLSSVMQGVTLAGAAIARSAATQVAGPVALNDLQFVATVTYSVANAANSIAVSEFSISR